MIMLGPHSRCPVPAQAYTLHNIVHVCNHTPQFHFKEDFGWFSVFSTNHELAMMSALKKKTAAQQSKRLAFDDQFMKPISER